MVPGGGADGAWFVMVKFVEHCESVCTSGKQMLVLGAWPILALKKYSPSSVLVGMSHSI